MNPPLEPTHALVVEALQLPERERAALAADLLASLHQPPGILREDGDGFADEANRRADRVRRGESHGLDWAEVVLELSLT
jgi:hypothetical protein